MVRVMEMPAREYIEWGFCQEEDLLKFEYAEHVEMIDEMYLEMALLITFSQVCHLCGDDWMWQVCSTNRPYLCPDCQDAEGMGG